MLNIETVWRVRKSTSYMAPSGGTGGDCPGHGEKIGASTFDIPPSGPSQPFTTLTIYCMHLHSLHQESQKAAILVSSLQKGRVWGEGGLGEVQKYVHWYFFFPFFRKN